MTDTANEIILDEAIAHALFLERLRIGESRRIGGLVRSNLVTDLERILFRRLERVRRRGFDSGPWTTEVYRRALRAAREIAAAAWHNAQGTTTTMLDRLAEREAAWQASTFTKAIPAEVQIRLAQPTVQSLRAIVRSRPMDGRLLRDWFRSAEDATRRALSDTINRGLARGDTVPQMRSEIRVLLDTPTRHAETIVRTAMTHTSARAQELVARENSNIVSGVQWISTLDLRTSATCKALDNRLFPIDEGPRPPAHPRCRSAVVPYLKPVEEILGVRATGRLDEATRASMDGQIPADTTFETWLRRQSVERQNQALGRRRAELFRSGVPVTKMVDRNFRPLTVEQIEARAA